MRKKLFVIIIILSSALFAGFFIVRNLPEKNNANFANQAVDPGLFTFSEIRRVQVLEVLEQQIEETSRYSSINASLKAKLLNGEQKGEEVLVQYTEQLTNPSLQKISPGDILMVGRIQTPEEDSYVYIDRYRMPWLLVLGTLFVFLAAVFGKTKGLTSVFGLIFSLFILLWFIAPGILAGKNPFLVTFSGVGVIAVVSLFLAHGFRPRTGLALISTLTTLGVAQILAYIFLTGGKLLGNGSDEGLYLQQGFLSGLNLQGILFAGIIISALGVLDDVTTAQSATIEEIHLANKQLGFSELFKRGSSVGREHIASLVNTLFLAYAGASLPVFLILTLNKNLPVWAVINSGALAEEIIRTGIGSIALILAVPISTALAAYYFGSEDEK